MKPLEQLSDDELAALAERASRLEDAPKAWIDAAMALWVAPVAPASVSDVARAALRVLHAVVRFDSWAQPAVALGMRSGASNVRHLVLGSEGRDIDLRIAPSAAKPLEEAAAYSISGQVLGPGDDGIVELRGNADITNEPFKRAALDDMGEFRIEGVVPGTYVLSLRFGTDEVVLPAIEVGA
jgi:hypothetical protein